MEFCQFGSKFEYVIRAERGQVDSRGWKCLWFASGRMGRMGKMGGGDSSWVSAGLGVLVFL
jgi:hypothetical protein